MKAANSSAALAVSQKSVHCVWLNDGFYAMPKNSKSADHQMREHVLAFL